MAVKDQIVEKLATILNEAEFSPRHVKEYANLYQPGSNLTGVHKGIDLHFDQLSISESERSEYAHAVIKRMRDTLGQVRVVLQRHSTGDLKIYVDHPTFRLSGTYRRIDEKLKWLKITDESERTEYVNAIIKEREKKILV
jgi:hypothetical protein